MAPRRVRGAPLLAGLLAWGASWPGLVRAEEAAGPAAGVPAACAGPVRAAEEMGRAIFEQDRVSAWGTDAVLGEAPGESRVKGWVTVPEGTAWTVHFIGLEEEAPVVLYQVRFAEATPAAARLSRVEPPRPAEGQVLEMFRARQAAMREPFERCAPAYNTVVLKDPASTSWIVYILAATSNPGDLVLGRHLRRMVAADGSKVLATQALSKGCMIMRRPPDSRDVAGPYVTHLVTPCPTEGHVFASLLYRMPIFVGAGTGTWRVDEGRVRFLEAHPPSAR